MERAKKQQLKKKKKIYRKNGASGEDFYHGKIETANPSSIKLICCGPKTAICNLNKSNFHLLDVVIRTATNMGKNYSYICRYLRPKIIILTKNLAQMNCHYLLFQ